MEAPFGFGPRLRTAFGRILVSVAASAADPSL